MKAKPGLIMILIFSVFLIAGLCNPVVAVVISGVLLDAQGNPEAGRAVNLVSNKDKSPLLDVAHFMDSMPDGRFLFENLEPGEYDLFGPASGYFGHSLVVSNATDVLDGLVIRATDKAYDLSIRLLEIPDGHSMTDYGIRLTPDMVFHDSYVIPEFENMTKVHPVNQSGTAMLRTVYEGHYSLSIEEIETGEGVFVGIQIAEAPPILRKWRNDHLSIHSFKVMVWTGTNQHDAIIFRRIV